MDDIELVPVFYAGVYGACANIDNPEIFFPEPTDKNKKDSIATAKSYCGICPIVQQCLQFALDNSMEGIWGETTYPERQAMRQITI